MVILQATNTSLTDGQRFSYLSTNYSSGVTGVSVVNGTSYSDDDFVVIGEWGVETTEVMQIDTVSTNSLTFTAATKYPHSESTKVTIIPYNQVKFYRTTTDTFGTGTLLSTTDIQPDDFYTKYFDSTYNTGYGWYVFYNSFSSATSSNSNAIPYGDFPDNSVKKIFDTFYSSLNNQAQSLITQDDAFRWLNEGYAIARNQLNLVNKEYNVPSLYSLAITSGVAEYELPEDFSSLICVYNNSGIRIKNLSIQYILGQSLSVLPQTLYYLRGNVIGFSPTPNGSTTYSIYYVSRSESLSSYYQNLDFPNNNFYFIADWMMMRAKGKLQRPQSEIDSSKALFDEGIQLMKITGVKQNDNLDSWEIASYANT